MSSRQYSYLRLITSILVLLLMGTALGCAGYRDYLKAETLYKQGQEEAGRARFFEALPLLEEAASLYEKSGYTEKAGNAYIKASHNCRKLGNLQKALDYAQKGLEIHLQIPANYLWQSEAYFSLGVIYNFLGEYDKSNQYLYKVLEKLDAGEKRRVYEKGWAQSLYMMTYFHIGNNYRDIKDCKQALKYHFKALKVAQRRHEAFRGYRADTFSAMGWMCMGVAGDYKCLGGVEKALEYYDQAMNYGRFATDKRFEALVYKSKADIYLLFPGYYDRDKALDNALKFLAVTQKYHIKHLELWAHQRLGRYYKKVGAVDKSIFHYQESIAILESLRGELKAEEYKSSFLENKLFIYEELILLLLDQKQVLAAFHYVERARSRALLDMLGNRVKLGKAQAAPLSQREQELNQEIESLLDKLSEEESKPEQEKHRQVIQKTSEELNQLRGQYQNLLMDLKQKNLEAASLVSVEPLKLPEIQALTGGEFTILEYYVTEKETLLWVVEKDNFELVRFPVSRKDLESKIEAFRDKIIKRARTEELGALSQELYNLLLTPALSHITSKTLCIIPHGVLHYLPFQALQNKEGQYLVKNYALFYASSASVLKFTFQKRKESQHKVLALGNPDLGNAAFDLPYAEEEVKTIGQQFPQKEVLVRKDATKKRAQTDSPASDIIHFACHGDLQEFSPLFSALRLAPANGQDGRLEVHEIFNLELNASLVTLSACKTGLGKLKTGDELIGLTRAFIYAGTPAVVASLWSVEDRSTYLLMSKFYQHLKTMPKAEALRTAQLEVAKEYPHPFFWAAFTLAGDWK